MIRDVARRRSDVARPGTERVKAVVSAVALWTAFSAALLLLTRA